MVIVEFNTITPRDSDAVDTILASLEIDPTPIPPRSFTPAAWQIELNAVGAGVHTITMIAEDRPLSRGDIQWLGGNLRWDEMEIALCNISTRGEGTDHVRVGDILQTTECPDAGMHDAFDTYGLPDVACLFVQKSGIVRTYCAPLQTVS